MKNIKSVIFTALFVNYHLLSMDFYSQLPDSILVFPAGSADYERKVSGKENSANYVWSQQKISSWAHAQGFDITEDSPAGGYQYNRGLVFYPPGVRFTLQTPVGMRADKQSYGWTLYLDMGFLKKLQRSKELSTDFKYYSNILRYDILVDGIKYKSVEIGFNHTVESPLKIYIPYVRDPSGSLVVEIVMKNHPDQFAVLYDAFLAIDQ